MTLKEFFESEQLLAIHLKTKEQSIIFSKEADKLGRKWISKSSYLEFNFWDTYKERTCYDNRGCFSEVSYYNASENWKVLNFEDIEWGKLKMNNFTKKDIKNGAVVVLRNGEMFLKVDDTLLNLDMSGGFMPLQKYDDNFDMIYENLNKCDIMKVLNPRENSIYKEACNLALCDVRKNNKDIKWTWERKEKKKIKLKDMTCEQYKNWKNKNCRSSNCKSCIFDKVLCGAWCDGCWVYNKEIYSENFLNQEVELGEIDNA